MKILVVEDQLEVLECLRSYFTDRFHEVHVASTADEALALLDREGEFHLALVDLLLPRGHGRQVIQEICKRGLLTRRIVITACDDLELRRELLALGVSKYLFKPVTIRDLDRILLEPPRPSLSSTEGESAEQV